MTLPKRSCGNVENGVQIAGPLESPIAVSLNYTGTFFFSSSLNRQCAGGSLFAVSVTPKNETAGKHFCCCVLALHLGILADHCISSAFLQASSPACACHTCLFEFQIREKTQCCTAGSSSKLVTQYQRGPNAITHYFLVHVAWQPWKQGVHVSQTALHSTAQKSLLAACQAVMCILTPKLWPCLRRFCRNAAVSKQYFAVAQRNLTVRMAIHSK